MSWASVYVGIPGLDKGRDRRGLDCWGLVRLVYREQLGFELPSYAGDYACAMERAGVDALIGREEEGWERVAGSREPFDVFVFREGRYAAHLGLHVERGLVLHTRMKRGTVIEPVTQIGPIHGAYRWRR